MKKFPMFSLVLLFVGVLFAQDVRAQDHTRWGLPEGALAHPGKGRIGGGDCPVAYSPDGTLAVATGVGIWLYNTRTLSEFALLQGHTWVVHSVSFSPGW